MKKHHLLLFGVFLLSSSCKTVTEHLSPDPEEVFPDSTGKFLQADKNSTPQTERIEGDWWKIFKDPQLDQLINRLNTYNPDAKAALARYEQSLAVLGITRSKILPTIRGNGLSKKLDRLEIRTGAWNKLLNCRSQGCRIWKYESRRAIMLTININLNLSLIHI